MEGGRKEKTLSSSSSPPERRGSTLERYMEGTVAKKLSEKKRGTNTGEVVVWICL